MGAAGQQGGGGQQGAEMSR
jgi:hypothetical protein